MTVSLRSQLLLLDAFTGEFVLIFSQSVCSIKGIWCTMWMGDHTGRIWGWFNRSFLHIFLSIWTRVTEVRRYLWWH